LAQRNEEGGLEMARDVKGMEGEEERKVKGKGN